MAGDTTSKTLTTPISTSTLLETMVGLLLVLATIVFVAWLLKRTNRFQSSANGQLKLLAGLPLGQRERIVLVQVGEQQLLVGVTPQQIQTLHVLDKPIETDTASPPPSAFANKLQQALQQRTKS